MSSATLHFGVIGAGIIGLSVARELLNQVPNALVTVFDKEDHPAAHQTSHNSGVVHAGLYYEPGSLKARLCRRGVELLSEYAAKKDIPYEECGKIVVALDTDEEARLKNIYDRAIANGVPGVSLIGPEDIRDIEPYTTGRLALHSPQTAIIDYAAVAESMMEEVRTHERGEVILGAEVSTIENSVSAIYVSTESATRAMDHLVICGGLQSDRLAQMAGGSPYPKIVPFFGQYSQLPPEYHDKVRGLVYPVPDPQYPFLGVHVTKRIDGEVLVGPNAFLSFGRENYRGIDVGFRDTVDVAATPAFWKFAGSNMKAAVRELGSVVSRKRFIEGAAKYVPALEGAVSRPLTRGIRAQAMNRDGSLVDDFQIEMVGRSVNLRNAPSPGATSSLAVAEHIVRMLIDNKRLPGIS